MANRLKTKQDDADISYICDEVIFTHNSISGGHLLILVQSYRFCLSQVSREF